jgi:hypothetical protein
MAEREFGAGKLPFCMWTAAAISLYLLPVLGFCLVRLRRGRTAIEAALDLPLAVALDLLLILLVSRLLRLDQAAFVARGVELVSLGGVGWRRRAEIGAVLRGVGFQRIVVPLLGALLALSLSVAISVPYAIWDRHWHIPLVASLRGQHAPFHNVYEPGRTFFYHYSGDALAAIIQSFSFVHLHSSAALSRAHDVFYAITGWFFVSALRAFGVRRTPLLLGLLFCTLAAGPATVLFEGTHRSGTGWSTINLLSLSFRPHEPLGYLFTIGLVCAGLAPLLVAAVEAKRSALLPLAASASVLALSDEPTLLLALGFVGMFWLVSGRSWREVLLIGLVPAAAIVLTVLVLGGTFAPGAPKQAVELVAARLPGFYIASLPFSGPDAWPALLRDYLGPLGVMLAALVSALGRRDARGFGLMCAHAALLGVSLIVLLFVRVNHDDMESHRAVTGIGLLTPLLLALWYARLPAGELRAWVLGIGGAACALGAVSTLEWVRGVAKVDAPRLHSFWGDDWFYSTDCVKQTGAKLGEPALLSVGTKASWYLFAGCRPVFSVPGGPPGGHVIVVGWPDAGAAAVSKTTEWAQALGQVRIFYANDEAEGNEASTLRRPAASCEAAGTKFQQCVVDGARYVASVRKADAKAKR